MKVNLNKTNFMVINGNRDDMNNVAVNEMEIEYCDAWTILTHRSQQ